MADEVIDRELSLCVNYVIYPNQPRIVTSVSLYSHRVSLNTK